jgi:hypothetical protein
MSRLRSEPQAIAGAHRFTLPQMAQMFADR